MGERGAECTGDGGEGPVMTLPVFPERFSLQALVPARHAPPRHPPGPRLGVSFCCCLRIEILSDI